MSLKIAVIGAGSLGFTRMLVHDILSVPEFRDTVFAFTDINKHNLEMVTTLVQRDIEHNQLPARLISTVDRREALKDADYILVLVRIGGLEAFAMDIDIPLKYGVDQCVGDTLCIGGIMYGQRGIAAILDFCRDIREVAKPEAVMFNYANPMVMLTWAANEYGGVTTIGLCHGVAGGHYQIAKVIEHMVNKGRKPGSKSYTEVTREDVDIICAGINHQTWYIQAIYNGEDWTGRLLKGFETHPRYSKTEKVRIDIIRRFGYFSTESNGHLSEYVPWYRKRTRDIRKWIDLSSWINGETGGYLRVCMEGRNWFKTDYPKMLKEKPVDLNMRKRSAEEFSYIIEGLETGRLHRGYLNVVNCGCISNLPDDAIVEVPCYIDTNGINITQVGDLPLGCAAVCNASVSVQRLAVEAAVHGDVFLLKQAAMMDPLTGAVCDPNEISQLVDEMLVSQARWLPQYRREVPKARKRLKTEKRLGTRKTKGVARLHTKTAAEMKKEAARARTLAMAADKANVMDEGKKKK